MGKPTGFLEIERRDRGYEKPEARLKTFKEFTRPLPEPELRQASGLDPVGMVEKRDAGAAEGQGVLHIVLLLQDVRGDRPSGLDAVLVAAARPVPDVPFVEAQHDALGLPAPRRNQIRDGDDFLD